MGTLAKTTLANSTQLLLPTHYIKGERSAVLTMDLRTKIEGVLHVAVGSANTTTIAFAVGVDVIVRRYLHNSGTVANFSVPYWADKLRLTSGSRLLAALAAAGDKSVVTDGFVNTAFALGDTLIFWGVGTIPTGASAAVVNADAIPSAEAVRMDVVGATGAAAMEWDEGLVYHHHDNEFVTTGNSWEIPLEGGYLYKLIIDYKSESAASQAIIAFADYQTINTYTSA